MFGGSESLGVGMRWECSEGRDVGEAYPPPGPLSAS